MKRYFLLILSIIFFLTKTISAQVGMGVGIDFSGMGESVQPKEKKKEKPKDAFIQKLAKRFTQDEDKLHKLWYKGYGRLELTKLLLIAEKTTQPLEEIVRLRAKEKIAKIAQKYNLDYKEIIKEAAKIKTEIITQETEPQNLPGSSLDVPEDNKISNDTQEKQPQK